MPYFLAPKILFGSGMLKRLNAEIEGYGNKAVLITDKNVAKLAVPVIEALQNARYEVGIWDGAEQEPSVDSAVNAGRFLKEYGPQLVLGFGGGSVMDTAKAAWILYERPEMTGADLVAVNPRSKLNLRKKARLITVPTTSGTGSEITWAIVLTDTQTHKKIGFANNEIVPDIALLIPELTTGMPKALTASTGLDVLGHALDGLTARQQNDFGDGLCLQAMKLTFDWLPQACRNGNDLQARTKMQNAAAIAGLGFGNSNTSLGHALAHAVGTTFGIPHGRAVGITLPYSLEYLCGNPPLPNAINPVKQLSIAAGYAGIITGTEMEAARGLVQKIRDLQREIGEPLNLKEFGISQSLMLEKLDMLVTLAAKDVNMYSSPCECKEENLRLLFPRIWGQAS